MGMFFAIPTHYNDVIMSTMASEITSLTVAFWTVHSRRRSNKTSKLHVTGLCEGHSQIAGEFHAQRASNAENVSIWWRHYAFWRDISGDWWIPLNGWCTGLLYSFVLVRGSCWKIIESLDIWVAVMLVWHHGNRFSTICTSEQRSGYWYCIHHVYSCIWTFNKLNP